MIGESISAMVYASEGNASAINSHNTQTMPNTELTLDQLTAIAGGQKHDHHEFLEWIKKPWCFPLPTDNAWPCERPGQDENAQ